MHRVLSIVLLLPAVLRAQDPPPAAAPKGDVLKFTFDASKVFPGTTRDVWVYVPNGDPERRPVREQDASVQGPQCSTG